MLRINVWAAISLFCVSAICLVAAAFLNSQMIVLPDAPKVNLSQPAFQFTLYGQPGGQGPALLSYAADPPADLRTASGAADLLTVDPGHPGNMTTAVQSVRVERADAGALLTFYTGSSLETSREAFSLSFALTIYEPTTLDVGPANQSKGNVQLLVRCPEAVTRPVVRVTLAYPAPHYFIL